MKNVRTVLMLTAVMQIAVSQQQSNGRDNDAPKSGVHSLFKTTGTLDRAAGIHNKGNVGMYFENRGKLYPRRKADGPDGEFPIKSLHDHIYRANPFVGIPGNVIQGKLTTNEEWEAVGGYHNASQPGAAYLSVAMSDNPNSWPASGWPVKDALGNPVFVSDQDSYCVYSDSGSATPIGLLVKQTGYCWGVKLVSNIIFYSFEIVNTSGRQLDGLYFSMYSEISIGNDSGGDPEYLDDKIVFDKAMGMYYKYDVDRKSSDWGMNPMNNEFGCMFLKSPKVNGVELGMTDFHRVDYNDDNILDVDSLFYGVMSSDPRLKNDPTWGPKLFHIASGSANIHFDDSLNIPTGDETCYQSSGPYTLQPGQTIGPFVVAFVGGLNHTEFMQYAKQAKRIVDLNWAVPSAPPPPSITVIGGDKTVQVSWDNKSEIAQDKFTGNFDFEGYKLYRSSDDGVSWTMLAQYDKSNDLPPNSGIQYTYEDRDVTNGFDYWYSITAYDRGDSLVDRLESSIGSNTTLSNLKIGRPHTDPLGYVPAATTQWGHTGNSNYQAEVFLKDQQPNDSRQDSIHFAQYASVVSGNLKTKVTLFKSTPADTLRPYDYLVQFFDQAGVLRFRVFENKFKNVLTKDYKADTVFVLSLTSASKGTSLIFSERDTTADFKPQAGDTLLISQGVFVTAGIDTILPIQPLLYNTPLLSTNRLLFRFSPPSPVAGQQLVAGSGLIVTAAAQYADSAVNTLYRISVVRKYSNNTIKVQVTDSSSATVPLAIRDSLNAGTSWMFSDRGVSFKVSFLAGKVPDSTTVYEVVTRKLVRPSYDDLYTFKLVGWSINNDRAQSELNKIKVVPNPYIVSSLYEKDYGTLRREPLRVIRFIHLPAECTISIFTMDGDLVQTINHSNQTGEESWDLRAAGKREIVAGIYLFLVKTSYGERLSRFAVIK
ncbi:MAG: hypothetical protein NTV54_10450 [Ignavibacteriales bacterium]|nr:hypothetical protein [Ignavibacteriales bacterium]